MPARIGTGLSTAPDPLDAGTEAARQAAQALGGDAPDLALVFASGAHHLAAPEALLEGIHDALSPAALIGCGAGGVLGGGRELEEGTAVSVWAGSFDGGSARPFRATSPMPLTCRRSRATRARFDPRVDRPRRPLHVPREELLDRLAVEAPGVPVLGGLASARSSEGSGVLLLGEEVIEDGAVGVALDGVELLPCVSQGAAPLGPELTITAAEGNVIDELAGRPRVETLQRVVAGLSRREQALVSGGVLIGIVMDSGKADYEQGDFLVRGIAGADPASGRLAVAAMVQEGQVIRLHARDAGPQTKTCGASCGCGWRPCREPTGGRGRVLVQRPWYGDVRRM